MALNRVILMGRLTRDPELRKTNSDISVTTFGIAVDKPYNKDNEHPEANFFDCVAWRERGENIAKYFTKGQRIVVEGSLQSRNYVDKEGSKRKVIEVQVDNFSFVEKKEGNGKSIAQTTTQVSGNNASSGPEVYETDEDDLPF